VLEGTRKKNVGLQGKVKALEEEKGGAKARVQVGREGGREGKREGGRGSR